MSNKTLIERLLEAGYTESQMYHWYSDLYIFVTPVTTKIIKEWCEDNNYRMDHFVSKFTDQITGKPMYDCAFQYCQTAANLSVEKRLVKKDGIM